MSGALVQSFFTICMAISQPVATQDSAVLSVEVLNIEEIKGGILIAVYGSSGDYMNPDKAFKMDRVEVKTSTADWNCTLPEGNYAIAVFHDVDDNFKLNTSRIGLPKEPYGFSNNVKGTFGPPSFEDSRVNLYNDKIISIKLR